MTESAEFPMELPAHGEVAGLLDTLAREYLAPGVQFAVYERGVISSFEYGEETYGSGRPVTADTVFPWGSVTKSATALLLAQLVSDGDLELDEPVGPLLPELAGSPDSPLYTATPRRLLSHTSKPAGHAARRGRPRAARLCRRVGSTRPQCASPANSSRTRTSAMYW